MSTLFKTVFQFLWNMTENETFYKKPKVMQQFSSRYLIFNYISYNKKKSVKHLKFLN